MGDGAVTQLGAWLQVHGRQLAALLIAGLALVMIFAGLWLIYPPLALIVGGFCLLGLLTADTTRLGRLTWPR